MKKSLLMLLIGGAILSCSKKSEVITTKNGIPFTLFEAGNGKMADPGSYLLMNIICKDQNDSIWINSYEEGALRPAKKVDSLWRLTDGGIEEVLFYLKEGDSVYFKMFAGNVYRRGGRPIGVEDKELLYFNIKIEDVLESKEEFDEWKKKAVKELEVTQFKKDLSEIDAYLIEHNIDAEKTKSGLHYVITQEGKGENVKSGQKITANYSGFVLNGPFFDSSIEEVAKENGLYDERREYKPFETLIGKGMVVKGWDEGFQLLNKGSKVTFYIPSKLAYGPRARSKEIQANSILVFDIELLDIVEANTAKE